MIPRPKMIVLSAALVLTVAAATASASDTDTERAKDAVRLEAARANAAEPVKTVRFLRPVHSYEIIGGQSVLVWETPTKAWLVDLRESAACRPRDLENGFAVGLESSYDTMNTSNGYITGEHNLRCKITQIREVDVKAMREAERAAPQS